jgi:hypothetical protein
MTKSKNGSLSANDCYAELKRAGVTRKKEDAPGQGALAAPGNQGGAKVRQNVDKGTPSLRKTNQAVDDG